MKKLINFILGLFKKKEVEKTQPKEEVKIEEPARIELPKEIEPETEVISTIDFGEIKENLNPPILFGKYKVFGVDVSHWDDGQKSDLIDWKKLNLAEFVIIKATDGETFVDEEFSYNWKQAKENGFVRGAYHFYRTNRDPIKQAKFFLKTVGKLDDLDLPLVIDFETDPKRGQKEEQLKAAIVSGDVKKFLDYIEKETGKTPIFYSYHAVLIYLNLDKSFEKYPLWLARYTNKIPAAPAPWKDWIIWQYSDNGMIEGIKKGCDFNVFNGEFQKLIRLSMTKNKN